MIHIDIHTTTLEIKADCDWEQHPNDNPIWIIPRHGVRTKTSWIYYEGHPDHGGTLSDFLNDGWDLPVEEFKKKWGVVKLYKLGKSHCNAGYTDRLNPEKSWIKYNPETLRKLNKWARELEVR